MDGEEVIARQEEMGPAPRLSLKMSG